jgi:hypothetical protein
MILVRKDFVPIKQGEAKACKSAWAEEEQNTTEAEKRRIEVFCQYTSWKEEHLQ